MTSALTVTDLTRLYPGGGGVQHVNFVAQDCAVTAVIGPNGAGKTALFSIIARLATAESGEVRCAHADATIAFCPHVPQFEPWLTAREVVDVSLAVSRTGNRTREREKRLRDGGVAGEALHACGLGNVMHRRVADFSRGMLQRLGIAAALVTDPDVLILDEPNSALDPIGQADVRDIIAEQKQRRCILLSSHLLSEIEHLADHIVVIDRGRVVAQGTTNAILAEGLQPVWRIRLGVPAQVTPEEIHALIPAAELAFETATLWRVSFGSFADAETNLLAVL